MSEYRLAEKPALDALAAMGWQVLSPPPSVGDARGGKPRHPQARADRRPAQAQRHRRGGCRGDLQRPATLSDNEEWQRKLRGGYSRRLSGENRDSPIALIDFKNPSRNAFHVTNQFRVPRSARASRTWCCS
jgi:type I restriction enzyme, R subunit